MPPDFQVSQLEPRSQRRGTFTILQLSDLHFSADVVIDGVTKDHSLTQLEASIVQRDGVDPKQRIDLVFVTGDLAEGGEASHTKNEDALKKAHDYLLHLCQSLKIEPSDGLRVIPGNHDVRRKGLVQSRHLRKAFDNLFAPYNRHTYYPELGLIVGCFDSVSPLHHFGFAATGTVAPDAVAAFQQGLLAKLRDLNATAREASRNSLKVALVHHNPVAVPRAEKIEPEAWYERALGCRLIGSAALMSLLNAGAFLQNLMEQDFRLVLHGHLHEVGYALHGRVYDEAEVSNNGRSASEGGWLEVIGCGSSFKHEANGTQGYNLIEVRDADVVQGCAVEVGSGDVTPFRTASNDLVRTRRWKRQRGGGTNLRCEKWSQEWDVILEDGHDLPVNSLDAREVILGLRSDDGKEVATWERPAEGPSLIISDFEVRGLRGASIPVLNRELIRDDDGQHKGFKYTINFNPPLTSKQSIDLSWRWRASGTLFSSVEDKRRTPVNPSSAPQNPAQLSVDEIEQPINIRCDRLLIRARFHANPDIFKQVNLVVTDEHDRRDRFEHESDRVSFDYWGLDRMLGGRTKPEAILSVYRPPLKYVYSLQWQLPDQDLIQQHGQLRAERNALRNPHGDPTKRVAVERFIADLESCFRKPNGLRAVFPGSDWNDPQLAVHVFAYDRELKRLLRVDRSKDCRTDFPAEVAWGRDGVGTAFRLRRMIGFSRPSREAGTYYFDKVDPSVQYILPFPLRRRDPVDNFAVGVVALVSNSPISCLQLFSEKPEAMDRLNECINRLWIACLTDLGFPPMP